MVRNCRGRRLQLGLELADREEITLIEANPTKQANLVCRPSTRRNSEISTQEWFVIGNEHA